ncbi:E3 ubiquitin-protein ligase SIAH1-like isoform X1 [Diorhabda sublineata]|uniref:E3 ubiquitin-protein ligase SIAH1-like isoform X1 n=2 Tax=Diorhabda sublineata TaxID=1163346 RepID=UPI0024E0ADA2|nr:E3 ubiquitin-protein ligase SIAH1-like isoform X1 [Diorhabda sublineata]
MVSRSNMENSLEKMLLEELSCPACYNYMSPPINQCQEGHSICHECFNQVKICPTCRGKKSESCRNYSLEAIYRVLNIPCRNQFLGCDFISTGAYINNHQKYCWFRKNKCPFYNYDNCHWEDSMNNLKDHLTREHSNNFYQKERQKFVSQNFKKIKGYHYIFAIMFAHGVYFRLTWEVQEPGGLTRWAVQYMGDPAEAELYSYKLEINKFIESKHSLVPLTYISTCEVKPEKGKFENHRCFYIHKYQLDEYCSSKGDLHYKITIYSSESTDGLSDPIKEFEQKLKQRKNNALAVIKEED